MINPENLRPEELPKYKYASKVIADVKKVQDSFKELRLKIENFIFNDGRSQDLVCLDGTIPVVYHSCTYNIPVAIFLYESHPHVAPMVFVRPTSTMQIKPSEFVENTGLVSLPYLTDWKHPDSDLIGLIRILQVVFGERSPVFTKVSTTTRSLSNPPPLPFLSPGPTPTAAGFYPQPPLLTGADGGSPASFMPSLPGIGWQVPQVPYGGGMAVPQLPNYNSPFPDPNPSGAVPGSHSTVAVAGDPRTGNITEEHLRLSLRSAVLDKVRRVQMELICQYGDELKAIQQVQSDLQCGGQRLHDMLAQMAREQAEATNALESVIKKTAELSEVLQRLSICENEPVNVDEAVDTTFPLYRQLLTSFAEEQAIEDAIYYLGKALGKGVLELDVFLKEVRELSRRQFMLRAIVQRCREKAGLPPV